MLEGGGEFVALIGVVAQPMEQLGKAPLVRINAAAPVDGFQLFAVRERGNLLRLGEGAVIAPEIVFIQRLHLRVNRNDAGAGGVESDSRNLIAGDARFLDGRTRGLGQRAHLIFMRLRGEVRVLAAAMQRILGQSRAQAAALAIHD